MKSKERMLKLVLSWTEESNRMERKSSSFNLQKFKFSVIDEAVGRQSLANLPKKRNANWLIQTTALTSRSFKNLRRDRFPFSFCILNPDKINYICKFVGRNHFRSIMRWNMVPIGQQFGRYPIENWTSLHDGGSSSLSGYTFGSSKVFRGVSSF